MYIKRKVHLQILIFTLDAKHLFDYENNLCKETLNCLCKQQQLKRQHHQKE